MSAQSQKAALAPITIEELHLSRGKLEVHVRVRTDARRTDERIARQAVESFPHLPEHSCVNDRGPAFASVIADTSVPHLLEHLVIDLQVAEEPDGSRARFAGHTKWLDESEGLALVTVSFRSDARALRALRDARDYLNGILAN